MVKFILLICLALSVIAEEKRDLLGSGIGMAGNVLWTKDMQVTGCKTNGYCNTPRCLEGVRDSGGIFGMIGNAVAATSAAVSNGFLSKESIKASCVTAGMYDENLNGPYGGVNTQYRVIYQ